MQRSTSLKVPRDQKAMKANMTQTTQTTQSVDTSCFYGTLSPSLWCRIYSHQRFLAKDLPWPLTAGLPCTQTFSDFAIYFIFASHFMSLLEMYTAWGLEWSMLLHFAANQRLAHGRLGRPRLIAATEGWTIWLLPFWLFPCSLTVLHGASWNKVMRMMWVNVFIQHPPLHSILNLL